MSTNSHTYTHKNTLKHTHTHTHNTHACTQHPHTHMHTHAHAHTQHPHTHIHSSNLTWRDIQYLVAYTSDSSSLRDGDWVMNGAGLNVSHKFGFGAIDAEAMVTRGRRWINVPSQHRQNNIYGSLRSGYAGQINVISSYCLSYCLKLWLKTVHYSMVFNNMA